MEKVYCEDCARYVRLKDSKGEYKDFCQRLASSPVRRVNYKLYELPEEREVLSPTLRGEKEHCGPEGSLFEKR